MLPIESRVYLERPTVRRERDFLCACRRSRVLHRGLVAAASTPEAYRAYLERGARPTQESFFVVAAATDELAGAVNILDVSREGARTGRLAYFAFVPLAGSGLMRLGLCQVIDLAFDDLGLVRLDADIEAGNHRSRVLARRVGFRRTSESEVARKIGSRWRMHERWSLPREEWRGAGRQELEPA